MNSSAYGITVIRLGMSGVLLWFGVNQLMNSADWTAYVPALVVSLSGISAQTIVLANGSAEIACGILLLLGVFTRPVAFVMAAHLAAIAFSLGNSAVGIRDWGLAASLLGLVFTGAGALAVDSDES